MVATIGIRLTNLTQGTLFLSDVLDGVDFLNSFRKAGPVYIPPGATVELVYTSSVALSFETGAARTFINQGKLSGTFITGSAFAASSNIVYRPGEPDPVDNVYATWETAYAAAAAIQGARSIQIDDSLVSPATVPAGAWDLTGITLRGFLSDGNVFLEFQDGATVMGLVEVTDALTLTTVSTSPVITYSDPDNLLILSRGGAVNGNLGIAPFALVPVGSNLTLVEYLGGTVDSEAIQIDGSATALILEIANVGTTAFTGTGTLGWIINNQSVIFVDVNQPGFTGTNAVLFGAMSGDISFFSASTITAPGTSHLSPGGGFLAPSATPRPFLIMRDGLLGNLSVLHYTTGLPNPITYEVLVNGIAVKSLVTDSSTPGALAFDSAPVKVTTGDIIGVQAVTAGVDTPTDILFSLQVV